MDALAPIYGWEQKRPRVPPRRGVPSSWGGGAKQGKPGVKANRYQRAGEEFRVIHGGCSCPNRLADRTSSRRSSRSWGAVVPYRELVGAGRMIAGGLVSQGKPLAVCMDAHWAGVWDLERLTDGEAVNWGLWVATQASTPS
jgi:hypothetical protein